jgi:hypothetical protein
MAGGAFSRSHLLSGHADPVFVSFSKGDPTAAPIAVLLELRKE